VAEDKCASDQEGSADTAVDDGERHQGQRDDAIRDGELAATHAPDSGSLRARDARQTASIRWPSPSRGGRLPPSLSEVPFAVGAEAPQSVDLDAPTTDA
jgi:hypothetical protein